MAADAQEADLSGQRNEISRQKDIPRTHWLTRLRQRWAGRSPRAAEPVTAAAAASLAAPDKVAFVLFGGGARGAAQAGALAVALEQGIRPDVIVAVSAGAWNGAYLAVDPTPERARQLCEIWAGLKNADLLGGGWWRAAISAVSGRPSLYGSEGPIRVARRYMDRHTFEELKTPLHILAANLTTGQPKLFSSGRVVPAILASSAVPGIFPPVVLDGQVYVDGGLLEWDACAEALRLGARTVYLFGSGAIGKLSPRLALAQKALEHRNEKASNGKGPTHALLEDPDIAPFGASLLDVLGRSWDVISQYQFRRAVEELREEGARVISIEPLLPPLSRPLDFNRCQAMIAAGRASAEAVFQVVPPPVNMVKERGTSGTLVTAVRAVHRGRAGSPARASQADGEVGAVGAPRTTRETLGAAVSTAPASPAPPAALPASSPADAPLARRPFFSGLRQASRRASGASAAAGRGATSCR